MERAFLKNGAVIAFISFKIFYMENNKEKNSEPTPENIKKASANYNPADRDFQRTEQDVDNVDKSEKEELEKRKKRLEKASTTPNKNRVS